MTLAQIVKEFIIGGEVALWRAVAELEKKQIEKLLSELLYLYANDKNSSTLREMVTLSIAGYEHREGKIGYNGFRGDMACDAKPKNITTDSKYKHNGGGNFSDFTYERLDAYKADRLLMLVSALWMDAYCTTLVPSLIS